VHQFHVSLDEFMDQLLHTDLGLSQFAFQLADAFSGGQPFAFWPQSAFSPFSVFAFSVFAFSLFTLCVFLLSLFTFRVFALSFLLFEGRSFAEAEFALAEAGRLGVGLGGQECDAGSNSGQQSGGHEGSSASHGNHPPIRETWSWGSRDDTIPFTASSCRWVLH
jgi:hypothetical protein